MSRGAGERTPLRAGTPADTLQPGEARRRIVISSGDAPRSAPPSLASPLERSRFLEVNPWERRRRALRRRTRLVRAAVVFAVLAGAVGWLLVSGHRGGSDATRVSLVVTAAPTISTGPATISVAPATSPTGAPTSAGAGLAPALPWAATGQSAVDIPAIGYRAQSGMEHPVPVASLTKIMTAYVVLRDHPIALGSSGPRITVTAADAANFATDTVTDQANVQLQAGEVLTEYQMLEGLLIHSANDLAFSLARWDAGSVPAFVAKMNATAASLGMTQTHFADASGYDSASQSTATDLLTVAAAAMQTPVFAQIVDMPSVTLPVAGLVTSYTPLVGTTDVVGVKTGFTNAAGGGDLLAYRATVGGHQFLALAAVTGQEGPTVLNTAAHEALAIARAAAARVQSTTVSPKGEQVARLSDGDRRIDVVTAAPADLLYLPGDAIRQVVHVHAPRAGAPPGAVVGSVVYELGRQRVSVPARTAARLP